MLRMKNQMKDVAKRLIKSAVSLVEFKYHPDR